MKVKLYVGEVSNGVAWYYPEGLKAVNRVLYFGLDEFTLKVQLAASEEELPANPVQVDEFIAPAVRISCGDGRAVMWEYRPGYGIYRIWRSGKTGLAITWEEVKT